MVVTAAPAADDTGNMHERTAFPSTSTVHAPQAAMPHPHFVPVRPTTSRMTQSSGVSGSPSIVGAAPLPVMARATEASYRAILLPVCRLRRELQFPVPLVEEALGLLRMPAEVEL